MAARIGVVTFPGSLDDRDAQRAVRLAGGEPVALWHGDADLAGVDAVVLPGGFSYGDYLRAGAIARFSPVVGAVVTAARSGMPVLGICNGFQVLCEAHLLPGALTRNAGMHFVCRDQWLRVENTSSSWTSAFEDRTSVIIPVKHGEGRFVASAEALAELEGEGRVAFRYLADGGDDGTGPDRRRPANPNGSVNDIAGIVSADGNVVGLMPHPEHAIEALTGPSEDGLGLFVSALQSLGVAA